MITDLIGGGRRQARTADICVIGAGTAGLALVRELLSSGYRVVVLESGGTTVEEETQQLYACTVAGLPHRGYLHGRFRTLGGTSTRWGGQLLPLAALDIDHREWIGAGAWPVTYADLQDYYQRVEQLFGVDEDPYESGARNRWPTHGTDFDANQFTARYAKWPPFARRNLARLIGKDCADSHSVEVVLHANVTELSLSDDGTRVVLVKARTLEGLRSRSRRNILSWRQEHSRQYDCCWRPEAWFQAVLETIPAILGRTFRIISPFVQRSSFPDRSATSNTDLLRSSLTVRCVRLALN